MKVTKRNAKRKKSLKTTEGARITTYIVEDGFYPKIVALKDRDFVTDPFHEKSAKKAEMPPKQHNEGHQIASAEVRTP